VMMSSRYSGVASILLSGVSGLWAMAFASGVEGRKSREGA
jgi:hypothetical protein